jgi:hypothetical protein
LRPIAADITHFGYTGQFYNDTTPEDEFRDTVRQTVDRIAMLGDRGLEPGLAGEAVAAVRACYGPVSPDPKGLADRLHAVAERREKVEVSRKRDLTFGAIVEEYLSRHVKGQRKAAQVEREIRREIIPHWKDKPLAEITRSDVVELIDAIADRPAPYQAHNILGHIRTFFIWAIDRNDGPEGDSRLRLTSSFSRRSASASRNLDRAGVCRPARGCLSIRPAGTCHRASTSTTTSPSCPCRHGRRSSIR